MTIINKPKIYDYLHNTLYSVRTACSSYVLVLVLALVLGRSIAE